MAAGQRRSNVARKVYKKYDLVGCSVSIIMIGPGGLLLVVPHTLAVAVLVSVLWMGLQKSKITKLGREKYFVQCLTY